MTRVRAHLRRVNLAGWLFVLLVAGTLEAVVRLFDLRDSVAAPSDAVRALVDGLSSGALSGEIGTTLEAYAEGFSLAVVCGVGLGLLLGSSRWLLDATSVLLEFLRPLPAVALIPVAILFFGLGLPMTRFVVAYAAIWPILMNTVYGVRGRDRMFDDVARTSGLSRPAGLFRVTLPAALPNIATGIRVSASIALLVGVTAEFVAGSRGVGAYMQRQQAAFRIPQLYAAVLLVSLLGYTINLALRQVERRILFWVGEERATT